MDKLSVSTMSRFFKMWKRRSTICAASICLTQPWRCCTIFAKNHSLLMRIIKNDSLLMRIIENDSLPIRIIENDSPLMRIIENDSPLMRMIGNDSPLMRMIGNIILWRSQVTHLGWEGLASPVLRKPATEVRGRLILRRGMIWRFDNQVL